MSIAQNIDIDVRQRRREEMVYPSAQGSRGDRQEGDTFLAAVASSNRNKPLPSMPPPEEHDLVDLDALHEEIERIQNAMDQRRLTYTWSENGNEMEEETDLHYLKAEVEDSSSGFSESLSPSIKSAGLNSALSSATPAILTRLENSLPSAKRTDRVEIEKLGTQAESVNCIMHSARQRAASAPKSPLSRPVDSGDTASHYVGPRKSVPLPDPSKFPDPYPLNPPQQHPIPPLSSAGSSSASTRSSNYTNPGSTISTSIVSGDYSHVRVATDSGGELDFGIAANAVAELLARDVEDSAISFGRKSYGPLQYAEHTERQRSGTNESSATSVFYQDAVAPRLKKQPSYDLSWQHAIRSRSTFSFGAMSEDETDGEQNFTEGENLGDDDDDNEDDNDNEERTRAIILAEAGRGMIVQCEGGPVTGLSVQPGTTHLLIGSSSTPNSVPSFLSTTLPQICDTLLALDISANFLVSLPPILASCTYLEELNIASNPLRVLPIFLANLTSLRVLIADSTGITTVPQNLSALGELHTLSVRRNKMNSLPSWLCLLPSLASLYIDGNPFQGPWKALVEPLMSKAQVTPMYPPSTPIFPQLSANSITDTTDTEFSDVEESPGSDRVAHQAQTIPNSSVDGKLADSIDEEHTITSTNANLIQRSVSVPDASATTLVAPKLSRTRTVPNQPNDYRPRVTPKIDAEFQNTLDENVPSAGRTSAAGPSREVRRMRSADELRRATEKDSSGVQPSQSASTSSTLISDTSVTNVEYANPQVSSGRFASLGVSSRNGSRASNKNGRLGISSFWEEPSQEGSREAVAEASHMNKESVKIMMETGSGTVSTNDTLVLGAEDKEKLNSTRRWGFLKKMSMGKMRVGDSPSSRPQERPPALPISSLNQSTSVSAPAVPQLLTTPQQSNVLQLNGSKGNKATSTKASTTLRPPLSQSLSVDALGSQSSSGLLAPPSVNIRATKRRSFLRLDGLPSSLAIPNSSSFVPGVTVADGDEVEDEIHPTPASSPIQPPTPRTLRKREEERIRESEARALRSVMAYLKDMNDLTIIQGSPVLPSSGSRSRRPTMGESMLQSEISFSSTGTSSSSQLRSSESLGGNRNTSTNTTMSVATTDSSGSGSEERKYKYDKGKRALVIREIIETERTYVKGLQELIDIYVKPASAPVTLLGNVGVSSSKENVIPAPERKVVFGGTEALFSFHKESFLPSLEKAASALLSKRAVVGSEDDDTHSIAAALAVGRAFVSHAAFMKMYSTYINNFDNAVQRIRHWTSSSSSSRPGTSAGLSSTMSPSSSSTQLATLGMAMSAVSSPASVGEGPGSLKVPALTANQRKRIRTYLKRCRANPRHSQLNLEGYLLLPVQRIPRYKLLLEELVRNTPPQIDVFDDPLEKALSEISSLATNMNEGKREAESRQKLVQWQSRIRGRFPSPLVQPHRRLIMDGRLLLTRVVRKQTMSFEVFNAEGDASNVQVDCLAPELTPRPLVGILCNDLLVLCRDPSDGQDPNSPVDLWAVLRMQTLPQPASIVHGNALRLVDNKAILYFEAPSTSDAVTWFRAINLHIPSSKT